MKYKVSFIIKPSKKKVTLGINSFDEVLKDKIRWLGRCYGKVIKLKIKKEVSKSVIVFLRRLIEEHMAKNKEYKS